MQKKVITLAIAAALILGSIGFFAHSNNIEAATGNGAGVRKFDRTGTSNGCCNGTCQGQENCSCRKGGLGNGSGNGPHDGTGPRSQNGTCLKK